MAIDPICGMTVGETTALRAERHGEIFFFCSEHCRQTFLAQPPAKTLPADLAAQADALADARTLATARDSFKRLSDLLRAYLEKEKIGTGRHFLVRCDMAKASWLQTDKTVANPYYGKSMLRCGQITTIF
jgi:YHS domain-containing protein